MIVITGQTQSAQEIPGAMPFNNRYYKLLANMPLRVHDTCTGLLSGEVGPSLMTVKTNIKTNNLGLEDVWADSNKIGRLSWEVKHLRGPTCEGVGG